MIKIERPIALFLVLSAAILGVVYLEVTGPDRGGPAETIDLPENANDRTDPKQGRYRLARPIEDPAGFVNAENVSIRELVREDRVVLVDFWTYTCVNCQRTFPYLNAWYEKYRDDGLTIVGVHSPEFAFEERRSNVVDAVERHGIEYPVVLDNEFATWANYDNRFWPQKYLIDVDGFIRYEHVGEGAYVRTERRIQELLLERARVLGIEPSADLTSDPVTPDAERVEYRSIETPELYLGAERNAGYLGNAEGGSYGVQELSVPSDDQIAQDRVYLGGTWRFRGEYAEAAGAGETLVLNYGARDVNIVAEAAGDDPVNVTVTVDGEPPGELAGADVAPDGSARIDAERLYDLLRGDEYGRHRLTITTEEPGLRIYTFTFG